MRFFPSAARQQAATAITVGALATVLLTSPWSSGTARADDGKGDLQHRRHEVRSRIHDTAADLEDSSREYAAATRKLAAAQRQLTGARAHLGDVRDRLASAHARSRELRIQLAASQRRLDKATEALRDGRAETRHQRREVRAVVLNGTAEGDLQLQAVSTLFSADSLDDLSRDIAVQGVVLDRNDDVYHELQVAQGELADQQRAVRDATDEVADKRQAAVDHVDVVRGLYTEARSARDQVQSLVQEGRRAREAAQRARARDRSTLGKLHEREGAIAARLRELARQAKGTGYHGASHGLLDYPANAPITSPFGYRVHPIYGYYSLHNGTDFGVPCGTPLHASASGTVVDEYYDAVYGNRLYLSVGNVNGKNMTLVYNHMTSYVASEGQRVQRGDVVGYSGTTGWSTGCHLHFTVLINGTAVNPMSYL